MSKNFRIIALLISIFGFRARYIGLLCFRIVITLFSKLTLALDSIFFPMRRDLKSPVFLIGHLRSGTTFMHRYLTDTFPGFRSLLMWEMIFPALIARAIFRPFLPVMKKISFNKVYDPNIHETGFMEPETDDIALSMRYFDGLLSWIYFHAWKEYPDNTAFKTALAETVEKELFVDYLKGVYLRAIRGTDQRMFSKSFCLLFNIDQVRNRFPGARFILIIRDPIESVISMFSLERGVQKNINDFDKQPEELKQRYFRNLYHTSLVYYHSFCDEVKKKNSDSIVIRYSDLFSDFEGTMKNCAKFLDIEMTPAIKAAIAVQAKKQGKFESKHKYKPEEFGFTAEEMRRDFAFVYEQFGEDRI